MIIRYYLVPTYGSQEIRLADPKAHAAWIQLTGNKQITGRQMELMNKLTGVTFEQVLAPAGRKIPVAR